jgi:hypothetical protein
MPLGGSGAGSSASAVAAAASVCVGLAGYFAYGAVKKSGYWATSNASSSSALNKKKQVGVSDQVRELEAFSLPPAKRQKTNVYQSGPASRGLFAELKELNAQFLGMSFYERKVRQVEKDIEQAQKEALRVMSTEVVAATKLETEEEQSQHVVESQEVIMGDVSNDDAAPIEPIILEEENQCLKESFESAQSKEVDSTSERKEQVAGEAKVDACVATAIAETIATIAEVKQAQEEHQQNNVLLGRSFVPRTFSEMLKEMETQKDLKEVKNEQECLEPKQRGGKGPTQIPGHSRRNKRKAQDQFQREKQQQQEVKKQEVEFTVIISSKQKQPRDLNKSKSTSRKVRKTYWKKVDLIQPAVQGATSSISKKANEVKQTQRRASITTTA